MHRKALRSRRGRCLARAIEPLESRLFLSLSAVGGEILVNTSTAGNQRSASIAVDADGDFVVAWQSSIGDGSSSAILAQRFNAAGTAVGPGFVVNTTTTSYQVGPSAAMDADGDFVITWTSPDSGGYGGIFAQRFNAAGVAQGSEFHVNTYTSGEQNSSVVAMDTSGDFVIAWNSYGQDGSYYGVYARRYNAAGVAQGTEFGVSDTTLGSQSEPSVAMSPAGDFVISWTGFANEYDTYARRYHVDGSPAGSEFRVNTFTAGIQTSASVAMDASGDFVVAWDSNIQDGHLSGVYAQRYNALAVAQGGEFKVNTHTTSMQRIPSAAMDADGDFVVTWVSIQDGDGYGIYAQAYSASGAAQGGEFKVNTYTTSKQYLPVVGATPGGNFIVAWESNLQDGSGYGVYAQRYLPLAVVEDVVINGRSVLPYQVHEAPVAQIVARFSENMTDAGGSSGIHSVTNPANWLITRNGADVIGGVSIAYGFNPVTNRYEAEFTLSQSYTSGNFLLKAKDSLRDIGGNPLDGNLDGVPGGNFLLPFSVQGVGPLGGEFKVNTYTTGSQLSTVVATDTAGNFVVVWQSGDQDGGGAGIFAQRYNSVGVAQGAEFRVNTFTTGEQSGPSVAMSDNGFVVTWTSDGQDGAGLGVYAQQYTPSGIAYGIEFRVNTTTAKSESQPSVAMDGDGDFVIVWQIHDSIASTDEVYLQRYDSSGAAVGGEFLVDTHTTSSLTGPDVAMDSNGAFVVAWTSFNQDGDSDGIYARRFNSSGVAQGGGFRVNSYTTQQQVGPSVAMSATGDFVVTWSSRYQDTSGFGVYAQRYNAAGAAQGNEFRVNTYTTNRQLAPSAAMDADGDFVITWDSVLQDSPLGGYGVYGQRYDAAGVAVGGEILINSYTTNSQIASAVGMDAIGNIVIAWRGEGSGDAAGIFARRFGLRDTPVVGTLADNPDAVTAGNSLTLSASNVTTHSGTVASVSFYRETNSEPGLQVGAFGDTLIGTDTTPSAGFWTLNFSTTGLPIGSYTYWAQATDDSGLTRAPASTTNTVTVSVLTGTFVYDVAPQKLRFTFNGDASASLGPGSVLLEKIGGGSVPALTLLPYGTDGTNIATFTMNTLLADGNYQATVSGIGGANVLNFFIKAGDANHDRRVDVHDLTILAANWLGTGKTYSQADFNYDGVVNKADLGTMALNWHQVVAQPAPALPAQPVSARPATRTPARTPTRVIDLVQ